MHIRTGARLRKLTVTAAAAAAMCVLAPFALAIGPVPITLCTLLIYLMACLLDWKACAAAVLIYVLMGAAGLPVFSGFVGGLAGLVGPTGGFIMGYPVMAVICALFMGRSRLVGLAGMAIATVVLYAVGTAWYCLQTGVGLWGGVAVCVIRQRKITGRQIQKPNIPQMRSYGRNPKTEKSELLKGARLRVEK